MSVASLLRARTGQCRHRLPALQLGQRYKSRTRKRCSRFVHNDRSRVRRGVLNCRFQRSLRRRSR